MALAQGSVGLIEVTADAPPFEVKVDEMPKDAASAVGKASITDRTYSGGAQGGSEGAKVWLRQYSRAVDCALRPILAGIDVPLTLAAAEPLASIYRSVNSYAHLADRRIEGNPETTSSGDLAAAAREILDELYADAVAALHDRLAQGGSRGLLARDLSDLARAASYGAVDTLLIDMDHHLPGFVDEASGVVTLSEGEGDAADYGVIDEVARRARRSRARVLTVRSADIPDGLPAIALLRYNV